MGIPTRTSTTNLKGVNLTRVYFVVDISFDCVLLFSYSPELVLYLRPDGVHLEVVIADFRRYNAASGVFSRLILRHRTTQFMFLILHIYATSCGYKTTESGKNHT